MDRRVAGQGEGCLLLVSGQEFAEIIASTPDKVLTLLKPDGVEKRGMLSEFAGWAPVPAKKIIKGDGTWMYWAPGAATKHNVTGSQWYTRGGVFV